MIELELRHELIRHANALHGRGLTAANSGNVSVRSRAGMLITPSGVPYEKLRPADLVELPSSGEATPGALRPSCEWRFHRDIYRERLEVHAVVHAHPPAATALAALRRPLPPFHYMVALAGGRELPCADYATFGTAALSSAVLEALRGHRACLMASHGLTSTGPDLECAFRLAVEMESLCDMYLRASAVGEVALLTDAQMEEASQAFSDYGQQAPPG